MVCHIQTNICNFFNSLRNFKVQPCQSNSAMGTNINSVFPVSVILKNKHQYYGMLMDAFCVHKTYTKKEFWKISTASAWYIYSTNPVKVVLLEMCVGIFIWNAQIFDFFKVWDELDIDIRRLFNSIFNRMQQKYYFLPPLPKQGPFCRNLALLVLTVSPLISHIRPRGLKSAPGELQYQHFSINHVFLFRLNCWLQSLNVPNVIIFQESTCFIRISLSSLVSVSPRRKIRHNRRNALSFSNF